MVAHVSESFEAERNGVKGTVTFKEGGPQWGAFHPGGDESIVIPLQKWHEDTMWWVECAKCEKPVQVGRGTIEVLGPYHSGCFGYPACFCRTPHEGDCSPTSPRL